jgi:ferredoxin
VCEPECPAEAIVPDSDDAASEWAALNAEYANKWPNITAKGESPADAEAFERETGKFEKYFSEKPGRGS